jgi:signal transduction histidine kinase
VKHRPYLSSTHQLLATTDWSRTPLGAPEGWPASLRGYVSMVMAMPTPAIIFWGPDLTQIYNDGYAQIMGPRHPRYFGAPYRECWPDTYPLIHPWMQRVLEHGEVVEVDRERIPVTRFGFEEDAYFTFTFSPLRDDAGRIAGILQPVFEVTGSVLGERRAGLLRSLALLQGDEALWPSAVAALAMASEDIPQAAIWQLQADGGAQVLAATPGGMDAAGGPQAQALAAQALATGAPAWREAPRTVAIALGGARPGGRGAVLVACTNPRLHPDAAYRQFLEMVAVELGSALQRARSATARERQRAFLQRMFAQAPAGIAVLRGPQHVFELTNPMYQALIGHRDVIGLPVREALPGFGAEPFFQILDRVYRTGVPYVGLGEAVRVEREGGVPAEEAYLNFVYQPLQENEGEPQGILVFCYEVTEQVVARQHSERLAEALRQEHTRKDEFLAMLAHELRNPLAPIRSAAELLARAPDQQAVVKRASEIVGRQVRHLAGLVDDLLDVSRVTRGLVTIEHAPQDLHAVLTQAVEQGRPLVEARGHRVVLDLAAQPLFVAGDHKRLVQVFTNLLNNAAKYTPDGGEIALRLAAAEGQALVSVEDTGIGIEPEHIPRLTERFYRVDRSRSRETGGTGLGLAIAKHALARHDATLEIESELGKGSRFTARFPARRLAAQGVTS